MKAAIPVVVCIGLILAGCTTVVGNGRTVKPKEASQKNAELALNYLHEGELQLAKLKAEKAIKHNKRNALANNVNGTVQHRLGNLDNADKYFRESVSLAPDQPEFANSYGVYLCEVGLIDDGVEQFVAVAKNPLHRSPALAYENAATCAIKGRQYDVAEDNLKKSLKTDPSYARARYVLAELQFRSRRYKEALDNVERLETDNQINAAVIAMGVRAATAVGRPILAEHYVYVLQSRFPSSYQARALSN